MTEFNTTQLYYTTLISVSILSAIAGGILKEAAEQQSFNLFCSAILAYSLSSCGVYALFRLDSAQSLAAVTFMTLILTILATQLISTFWLQEAANFKSLSVVIVAAIALAATLKPTVGG